ncbi:MAG: hypothetical protein GX081_01485 [Firmicutes bacterium]|nr:hypothetical protein [Bacillota bacterium]
MENPRPCRCLTAMDGGFLAPFETGLSLAKRQGRRRTGPGRVNPGVRIMTGTAMDR